MGKAQYFRLPVPAIAAGLLFFVVPTIEIFARPGFDLSRHAISMLSLGERGWVMVAIFIVSGFLVLLSSIQMRKAGGGIIGPFLIALYGAGLVLAGMFPAPAGLGFPPGTPDDQMPVMTQSAILHSIGFMVAFSSLIAACFVYAGRFRKQGLLGFFSLAAGVILPALIGAGMAAAIPAGIAFYIAAMLAWLWLGIVTTALARR